MSPALLGLVLAVPLSAFMGSAARRALAGAPRACSSPPRSAPRRRSPPRPTREAEALRARAAAPDGLAGPPRRSRRRCARHLAWLDPPTSRRPGEPDAALASALLKLADGLGLEALDARETFAVLASPPDARRPRAASPVAARRRQVKYL